MKRIVLVVIISLWFGGSFGHGLNVSTVELTEEEGQFILSFNLSKADLYTSVVTAYPELINQNLEVIKSRFSDYIKSNFSVKINDDCQDIDISQIEESVAFIKITGNVSFTGKVELIDVYNHCLVDYNDEHQNIFRVNLNGKLRTFRLTAERLSTQIKYES